MKYCKGFMCKCVNPQGAVQCSQRVNALLTELLGKNGWSNNRAKLRGGRISKPWHTVRMKGPNLWSLQVMHSVWAAAELI
jgi:hypothetical protein